MKRIAVIGAILENPAQTQEKFNELISSYKFIVKGRIGIPIEEDGVSVISIVLKGEADEINALTGKLGKLDGVTVKTTISKEQ